jgi:UDP-GlcNAc:undecaprenyl-phosphate GlcNAc-1-phosphate transferase
MTTLLVGTVICAIVTLLSPWGLRPVLAKLGALDVPNSRSSHGKPVLRGGGAAVVLGMLAGAVFVSAGDLWLALGFGVAAAMLGLIDDLRDLSAKLRLAIQLLLATALGVTAMIAFGAHALYLPLIAFFFIGYINVANFMDGLDAISSLHAATVGAAFAIAGFVTETEWLAAAGLLLGAGFLAFLPWNLFGARLFLGDIGSYLLGGFIAAIVVVGISTGLPWQFMLAPLAVYTIDVAVTIIRRSLRGARMWDAHREHFYQQLAQSGFSHVTVSVYVASFTALSAGAGFIALTDVPGASWIAVAGVFFLCVLYIGISSLIIARRKARTE